MTNLLLPMDVAETILGFYLRCMDAERFFEVCQAPSYRRFLLNAVHSKETENACGKLEACLKAAALQEGEEEPQQAAKPKTKTRGVASRVNHEKEETEPARVEGTH